MTADPQRRRRASRVGIAGLVIAFVVVAVLSVVAVVTLRSSEEGSELATDDRPEQTFPSTPVGIVAVTAGERLSALAVFVVAPSGQGGSIVPVPVNVDTSAGFGDERTPLARRVFSTDDASALRDELAPTLGIEPSFVAVVDAELLADLLGELPDVVVTVEDPIIDAGDGTPVTVVEAGDRRLDRDGVVAALTAVPPSDGPAYDHHAADAAVWEAVAEVWSLTNDPIDLERDEAGTPVEPASFVELAERVRAGRVGVRDLAIDPNAAITLDNPTAADFVIVDARDANLVFASVAPERVLTPNPTLNFSIVAPFNRSQLASADEEFTTSSLVRELIGELFFFEANVVSIDTEPLEGGAAAETVVIVDDASFQDVAAVPTLIGPSTSRIAARDTDGNDVLLILGTDFLAHRAELDAERAAERASGDDTSDFDVSAEAEADGEPEGDAEASTDEDEPAADDGGVDPEADQTGDTVTSDE